MRQDNLHGDKKQSKGKRGDKFNPKISEPVLGFSSTGQMFANANSTLANGYLCTVLVHHTR
jgi:hypothetical protein